MLPLSPIKEEILSLAKKVQSHIHLFAQTCYLLTLFYDLLFLETETYNFIHFPHVSYNFTSYTTPQLIGVPLQKPSHHLHAFEGCS